ncbi:MAG: hypothetical protein KF876_07390 [Nitrospira sp.]|nr:hypothetical protein [Nitrospira sp.]
MKLPHEEDAVLDFLHDVGLWATRAISTGSPDERYIVKGDPGGVVSVRPQIAMPVILRRFWQAQEELREFLINPKLWEERLFAQNQQDKDALAPVAHILYLQPLPLTMEWRGNQPIGAIKVTTAEELLAATTHIDLIRGAKFKVCERPDCKTPFPILSGHARKYCDWYCGHIESVRRTRMKAKRQRKDAHHGTKTRAR